MFNNLTRDILRELHFPQDGDDRFQIPTESSISRKLGVSFSRVSRRMREMRESGLIPERLSMTINTVYVGISKFITMGIAPKEVARAMEEIMRRNPPRFVESFYRVNTGPPHNSNLVVMEIINDERNLRDNFEFLTLKFPGFQVLEEMTVKVSPESIKPSNEYEAKVLSNLRIQGSLERRILKALWEDTSSTVPAITDKVYPRGKMMNHNKKYRTVKRILDAMVRLRAFWFFPTINSSYLDDCTMFSLTVLLGSRDRRETLRILKELLKDEYVMFRDYYSEMIPKGCIYHSRREYEQILEKIRKEGLEFVVYEDFNGFTTGNWPLE
jgi:DNA-binding Lrp family transcriptional regulator